MALKRKMPGKIGVLMGGPSCEREVSLKSGKAVCSALEEAGLKILPIDIKSDDPDETSCLLKSKGIDCAFVALHGRFGEDGQVQQILEALGITYTGSGVVASRLAMDKAASRQIFELHGLRVPRYDVLKNGRGRLSRSRIKGFGFPLVVKPANGGSSVGLSIIEHEREVEAALKLAFDFDESVIVEEYIKGREVTVGILDEDALPVIEIVPKKRFFDYEAKYTPGMTDYRMPAQLRDKVAAKIKDAALSAHRLLGCSGCSRVDMILGENGASAFVLEVNTIPGMTATSLLPKAARMAGIDFAQLCLKLITSAYEKT